MHCSPTTSFSWNWPRCCQATGDWLKCSINHYVHSFSNSASSFSKQGTPDLMHQQMPLLRAQIQASAWSGLPPLGFSVLLPQLYNFHFLLLLCPFLPPDTAETFHNKIWCHSSCKGLFTCSRARYSHLSTAQGKQTVQDSEPNSGSSLSLVSIQNFANVMSVEGFAFPVRPPSF